MTCLSEDEWEELDRRAARAYRIFVLARRLAILLLGTLLFFLFMWFFARHAAPVKRSAWDLICTEGAHSHE